MDHSKTLYRSSKNRMIGGVCGGIAEYFDIDPAIVRLIWVIFVVAGGAGFWAYIIAWVVIPENPKLKREEVNMNEKVKVKKEESDKKVEPESKVKQDKKNYMIGIILVIIGAIFLANNFIPAFRFDKLWPLVLVAVGLGMLFTSNKRE